ncbi:MAG TPA: SCO family protein [Candidatus Binatia bacterium]
MEPRLSLLRQHWVWALLICLLIGVGLIALWPRLAARPTQGTTAEKSLEEIGLYGKVPPFSLVDRSGKEIQLSDLLGKVWIADLIYTHCPDTCPVQSAEMKTLQDKFAREADLRLVSITVDPKRDTPPVLDEYAARFGADPARWFFLTGKEEAILRLAKEGFRLPAAEIPVPKRESGGATHAHSPRFVVVDRNGEIRGYFSALEKESLVRLRRTVEFLLRGAK